MRARRSPAAGSRTGAVTIWLLIVLEAVHFSVLTPLLPVLDEQLGLGPARVGQVTGAYLLGIMLAIVPAGAVVARLGTRASVLIGLVLLGGGAIVVGVAGSFVVLSAARVLQGVGSAVSWAGAMAGAISAARPERRGSAMGAMLAAAFVGTFLGPLVGGLAGEWGRAPVLGALASVCVLVGAAVLKWWPRSGVGTAASPASTPDGPWRRPTRASLAIMVTVVAISVAGGARVVLPLLPLSDGGVDSAETGALFSVGGLAMAVVAVTVGRLSDRLRPGRIVAVGAVGALGCAVLFALASDAGALAVLVVLLGCAVQVGMTAGFAVLTTEHADAGIDPAISWTYLNLAWTGGFLFGNVGPSWIASFSTTRDAWFCVAGILAAASAATYVGRRRPRSTTAQHRTTSSSAL